MGSTLRLLCVLSSQRLHMRVGLVLRPATLGEALQNAAGRPTERIWHCMSEAAARCPEAADTGSAGNREQPGEGQLASPHEHDVTMCAAYA